MPTERGLLHDVSFGFDVFKGSGHFVIIACAVWMVGQEEWAYPSNGRLPFSSYMLGINDMMKCHYSVVTLNYIIKLGSMIQTSETFHYNASG